MGALSTASERGASLHCESFPNLSRAKWERFEAQKVALLQGFLYVPIKYI